MSIDVHKHPVTNKNKHHDVQRRPPCRAAPRPLAEKAKLSGGAGTATEHAGHSGSGFVDGYGTEGATTTFDVDVGRAGTYDVGLRYANGPHPFTGTKSVSV